MKVLIIRKKFCNINMVTDGVTINRLIVVVILQCIQKLNHYVVQNDTSIMLCVNCGGCCLVSRLYLTLCNPLGYSPPGSSVHGISQARILEWIAISFSRGSSWLRNQTCISCLSCIGRWIFYHWSTWEALMIRKLCLSKAVKKNYNQRM